MQWSQHLYDTVWGKKQLDIKTWRQDPAEDCCMCEGQSVCVETPHCCGLCDFFHCDHCLCHVNRGPQAQQCERLLSAWQEPGNTLVISTQNLRKGLSVWGRLAVWWEVRKQQRSAVGRMRCWCLMETKWRGKAVEAHPFEGKRGKNKLRKEGR